MKFFPGKNLRNLFLRMATPKIASFTELIFADHEFSTHFCGINFCDFGANPQKLIPQDLIPAKINSRKVLHKISSYIVFL